MKYIFPVLVLIGWLTIAVLFVFFWWQSSNDHYQKAVFAGYADSSITDYRLQLYVDSTYQLTTLLPDTDIPKKWWMDNDTIKLGLAGKVCARFYSDSLFSYDCDPFRCLTLMKFKAFETPQHVVFPKKQ